MLKDLKKRVVLTCESLFDGLHDNLEAPGSSTAREAIQLGYAVLRLIPWILGIRTPLQVISILANQVLLNFAPIRKKNSRLV